MKSLRTHDLAELLVGRDAPCLSLYQPTHRSFPDNQQDSIRFKNLVKSTEESLRKEHRNLDVRILLAPFHALGEDHEFWNHALDGLAVFGAHDFFRAYKLQRTVGELAVVADSFHIKPLIRTVQSADRFQVLALSRKAYRLFEGNRDALDEVDPHHDAPRTIEETPGNEPREANRGSVSKGSSGTVHYGSGSRKDEQDADVERFFRAVDRAVLEHQSKPSGLPLILAALTENQEPFRKVSHNPALLPEGIETNPDALSADELRAHAWKVAEPHHLARLAGLVEEYGAASSKWGGDTDLAPIAEAAVAGRVKTLMVEADRQVPGRIDPVTGRLAFTEIDHPEVDDLLDDLAEFVLKKGGDVVVVPAPRMPGKTGAAAIYRF